VNRSASQFVVAVLAMFFLGSATLAAVVGDVFWDSPSEITFALITALSTATGAAAAYLFRLNGTPGG
jgi:hypothetical protein